MEPLKAVIIGLGSAGDVYPNVGLAVALRDRGHDVLLVAPAVFRRLADEVGLDFAGLLSEDDYYAAIRDPDLWHPFRSFSVVARRLILPAIRPVFGIIREHYRPGRTVVAAPGFAFGARMAQEKMGVPLATLHLQPILLRSAIQPACFGFPDLLGHLPYPLRKLYLRIADRFFIDRLLAQETNDFRAEVGLPPVRRFFNSWIHSPQLIIGFFPDWFAPPAPDWPPNVTLAGFPLWDGADVRTSPPELEAFLAAGEPPLVFTAGSAMLQAKKFFQVSAEVCDALGRRAILLTQFPEQLPPRLPDQIRHFDYVPFSSLLPRSAALIHHGGIGTTAQAIAAGIPQLVIPTSHDQPDNAVRIGRLGLGDFLLPAAYIPSRVREKLGHLMSAEVSNNCHSRAAELDGTQSLRTACSLLEQLAM